MVLTVNWRWKEEEKEDKTTICLSFDSVFQLHPTGLGFTLGFSLKVGGFGMP